MQYGMGAVLSPPDSRDFIARAPMPGAQPLPAAYDLRGKLQPIRNQGAEGLCTTHALASGLLGASQLAKPYPSQPYNRLLGVRTLYEEARLESGRNGRAIAGEGAHMRDVLRVAYRDGVDLETDRPYTPHAPGIAGPNSPRHRRENKVGAYASVIANVPAHKLAIIQYSGVLVVIDARDGFMTPINGKAAETGASNGYHAVCLVGFDDSQSAYILRNSWGPEWGREGYCLLPYSYEIKESWVITPALSVWAPAPRPFWWPWFMGWDG